VKDAFNNFDRDKLSRAFVLNEQIATSIYNEKRGNSHAKLSKALHFNVRRCCVPAYPDDEEQGADEDEHCYLCIRKPSGVTMIECLEDDMFPRENEGRFFTTPGHHSTTNTNTFSAST
jgi:hypothetical protein